MGKIKERKVCEICGEEILNIFDDKKNTMRCRILVDGRFLVYRKTCCTYCKSELTKRLYSHLKSFGFKEEDSINT